eukprot:6492211-Amphidinium_carterae.3
MWMYVEGMIAVIAERSTKEVSYKQKASTEKNPQGPEANAANASQRRRPCPQFITSTGCPHGGKCPLFHPTVKDNRCSLCGATDHQIKECTRPRRERKEGAEKGGGKSKGSEKGKKGKGKGKGKHKSKDKNPTAATEREYTAEEWEVWVSGQNNEDYTARSLKVLKLDAVEVDGLNDIDGGKGKSDAMPLVDE